MSTDKIDPSKKEATISSTDDVVKTTKSGDVELTEKELKRVVGGATDGSLEAGIHFKYDIKGQKEG